MDAPYIQGPSPQEEVRPMVQEMEAPGQEEEIQVIQPAVHTPEEEVQVPIPREEHPPPRGSNLAKLVLMPYKYSVLTKLGFL